MKVESWPSITMYCLALIEMGVFSLWLNVLVFSGPGLTPYDQGEPLQWVFPVAFLALGGMGIFSLIRLKRFSLRGAAVALGVGTACVLSALSIYALFELAYRL